MATTEATDFNKRLGAAVRKSRILAGMSQSDLGDQLNVTFQQVQKYERGVNRISVETLLRIAKALNTAAHELISAAAEDNASAEGVGDRMKLQAVRGLSRMTEKSQRLALNFINALAGGEAA